VSQGCTNPVVLQCAPSGANATRTGSFDRINLTVYHNDTTSGAFGNGGVQILAGAVVGEGIIHQFGNFGGTGQAGVYALYVSGSTPAGVVQSSNSAIVGVDLQHGLEYDGTGTAPGTVFIGASNYIEQAKGVLWYAGLGAGSISASAAGWQFDGPIHGDNTILNALWGAISAGFPAGMSGTVRYSPSGHLTGFTQGDMADIDVACSINAATTINQNTTLFTLPSGFYYPTDNKLGTLVYTAFGAGPVTIIVSVGTTGHVALASATIVTPGGGTSFLYGNLRYPTLV